MNDISTSSRLNVEFALPDAVSTGQMVIDAALEYVTVKMALSDEDAAVDLLREGNSSARGYFEYGLARELGENLGVLDGEVRAVYLYNPEATPEDSAFGGRGPVQAHLIIWAARKTSALNSALSALSRALGESYARKLELPQQVHLIDAQVVDTSEVEARSGFGALLSSMYNRPLLAWKR